MQSRFYGSTLRAGVALALALGGAAHAQEMTGIDEIIVTARRVEESLQDVPISITVVDAEQISNRNISVAADLGTYTPSLAVNQRYGAEKSTFAIRGFNQDQSTAPTVGVYFADVVGVRAQGGTTSGNTVGAGAFTDLQNVQVLKGPQGTLFGRNTTGGAVLLVPKKPTHELEGYGEVSAGNYDMRRFQGALNVPINDMFRVRFSTDIHEREGYMKNQSGIGPDDYNDLNYWYGRLSLVADITPNLENYLIAHYSHSQTNGYAGRLVVCDRGENGPPNSAGLARFFRSLGCAQIDRQAARGDGMYDVDVGNPDPRFLIETWQIINTTTWRASDSLTVKNIASYGEFKERSRFNLYSDNFFVPQVLEPPLPPLPTPGGLGGSPIQYIALDDAPSNAAASQYTITEELQFQGSAADGRLNWVAGGYLEFSRPIGWNHQRTGIALNCTDATTLNCIDPYGTIFTILLRRPTNVGTISNSRTRFNFDNHGIFAQGTYNFTDQWALTLGGRYTFDKIVGWGESTRFVGFPGATTQFCNDTLRFRGSGPQGGLIVSDPSECRLKLKEKSNEPTWLVDLDFKPTDDVLVYGKYARGYRQGGLSFTNVGLETWDPEQLDAYELGTKLTFSTGAVSGYFNAAAFYNDFQDQQVFAATTARAGEGQQAGAAVIVNAAKSVIQGIEIDSSILFFNTLRLDLGYTYLDTEVKDLKGTEADGCIVIADENSPFSSICPRSAEGDPLSLSPKHRLTAGLTYTLPFPENIGQVQLGATYVYTAKQEMQPAQLRNSNNEIIVVPDILRFIPKTDIVNLNLNWNRVMGSPVNASFFMTNVTDEKYPVNTGGGYASSGFGDLLMAPPRMYGFRLRYNFGAQ